jgi:hypothetical protein
MAAVQAAVFGLLFAVGQAAFGDGVDATTTVALSVLLFALLCLVRWLERRAARGRARLDTGQRRPDGDAGAG